MNKSRFALFNFPFRLFFLLTGLYGVVTVGAWMSYLFGGIGTTARLVLSTLARS